ncbi:hypothetical protein [Paenibacillus sp. Soil522]|uniref:hypothetical protein n=1 Tax=Paenibacillus sp. Soil522 TaxID=1736388 RepID=UPI000700E79B|nr:hypothetical protein [Paenibacillus sp. Soil522]KRE51287.1 hypothetical protein ASG81_03770 [Paenibacillus sp. Soil522]
MNKKKLATMASVSLLTVSLAIGAGTYAIFTSSAQNINNTFASGIINLTQERNMGDSIPGPMFYSSSSDPSGKFPYDKSNPLQPPGGESIGGWAPGDTVIRAMNIYNNASNAIDAKVTKVKANVNTNGLQPGSPAYEHFVDNMKIKIQYPAQNKTIYDGYLRGLLNGYVNIPAFAVYANGGAANITFTAQLDLDTGNVIQGQTFVFDFEFFAEQLKNN